MINKAGTKTILAEALGAVLLFSGSAAFESRSDRLEQALEDQTILSEEDLKIVVLPVTEEEKSRVKDYVERGADIIERYQKQDMLQRDVWDETIADEVGMTYDEVTAFRKEGVKLTPTQFANLLTMHGELGEEIKEEEKRLEDMAVDLSEITSESIMANLRKQRSQIAIRIMRKHREAIGNYIVIFGEDFNF